MKDYLKSQLIYNPETGIVTWTKDQNNGSRKHTQVGCLTKRGYLVARIKGKQYKVHRLAWLLFYGEFPDGMIDHINRDKTDNRIANLRIASPELNSANINVRKSSKSGILGVHFCNHAKKWKAKIQIKNKSIHLGYFDNAEDAKNAYEIANKKRMDDLALSM